MKFIGQNKIRLELNSILENIDKSEEGVNILFSGFAGCGKTELAKTFLSRFGDYGIQFPTNKNQYKLFWDDRCEKLRGMFFDEVHLFKNVEELYPILDRKEKVIVLATNILELPDALISRCFVFIFSKYSDSEIGEIILNYSKHKKFIIEKSVAEFLASFSRGSPRVAKNIFDRCLFIISRGYYKRNINGFLSALRDIGIYEGGYTDLDINYLQLLKLHGPISLDNICRVLQVTKNVLINDVEPFLIERQKIKISSRGRSLI